MQKFKVGSPPKIGDCKHYLTYSRTSKGLELDARSVQYDLDHLLHHVLYFWLLASYYLETHILIRPEVPSNIFLKRFRPHVWLPITMVIWGGMLTWMGFVKSYGELLAARAMLGVFEAGVFPGVNYYLSCWYKRNEFGLRAAIFFSAAAVCPPSSNDLISYVPAVW